LRQFLTLLGILGVATVILGTLVGGWFGFPIRELMVLDPLEDPVSFLILSLALGFVQVWFGTFINMISGLKSKDYLQSIFVQGGWLILLPSLVLYALLKLPVFGIFALVGAAGLSSSLVALRYDLAEIMTLMSLPEDQVSMIAALELDDGWPMALINAFVWGTFLVYLITLRRFFKAAPIATHD